MSAREETERIEATAVNSGAEDWLAFLLIVFSGNIIFDNMIVVPVGATLALVWARLSGTPFREIGFVRPRSWIAALAAGLVLGCALKIVLKTIVMPLVGADPINRTYHFLVGNQAALPAAIVGMLIVGFAEETVFRGYMFERFSTLFGRRAGATAAIVLLTSVWFGASHYADQGSAGVAQGTIVGVVFGSLFAARGRIFTVMVAHAAFDLTALGIIYWGLESRLAHLFFP
jgi:membrane protease YdiL (CAAX protease family)